MNHARIRLIADAVLYEGYILYPYRPSVKNRQRWTFGGLYPEAYCRAQAGADASCCQTECLVQGGSDSIFQAIVRFLHLTDRRVGELIPPLTHWPSDGEPAYRIVDTLQIGGQSYCPWQEAAEHAVPVLGMTLGEIVNEPRRQAFTFPGKRWLEPLRGPRGEFVGVLARVQEPLEGIVEVEAVALADGLSRVTLRIRNGAVLPTTLVDNRDEALLRSLISTHAILGIQAGEFVSLLDPPEMFREAAAGCRNIGVWPVLVGEQDEKNTMLSSPIILYDYPQIAPESPGDLFDGTEIDEILTLRILTLTDAEKSAAVAVDGRVRELLARTESLAREQLMELHGTLRPTSGENV